MAMTTTKRKPAAKMKAAKRPAKSPRAGHQQQHATADTLHAAHQLTGPPASVASLMAS